jgi:uncharacterized damage-inducible protein DinB
MSKNLSPNELIHQLHSSQEFFNRSTGVLEESDSAFRPTPAMMTAVQQVTHVAHTITWFMDGALSPKGFDLDFEKAAKEIEAVTSLAAAREMLATAYSSAISRLKTLSSVDLAKPLPPGPVMGGQPTADIFWGIIEHTAHHRGALTVYSRLLGKVPAMPYM